MWPAKPLECNWGCYANYSHARATLSIVARTWKGKLISMDDLMLLPKQSQVAY
jgi:hypothetical protein